jgi:hypothetical protein
MAIFMAPEPITRENVLQRLLCEMCSRDECRITIALQICSSCFSSAGKTVIVKDNLSDNRCAMLYLSAGCRGME